MIKRAIVTGASSGIGRATAVALAQAGIEVVLSGRDAVRLSQTATLCAAHGRVESIPLDLEIGGAIADLVQAARAMGQAYPVLVNAAGVAEFGPFADADPESLTRQVTLNLIVPGRLCREVLPWMLDAGGGSIVNVLSIAATSVLSGAAAYAAGKAGLLALGRGIAADHRRQGVRVTSVIPGAVDTELWDRVGSSLPREKMLRPSAVAQAIVDVVTAPADRTVDELVLMPPEGIL